MLINRIVISHFPPDLALEAHPMSVNFLRQLPPKETSQLVLANLDFQIFKLSHSSPNTSDDIPKTLLTTPPLILARKLI
jgi:hypothetical protein